MIAMIITNRPHPRGPPREACIRALARQAIHLEAQAIVLERDWTIERSDRRWLFEELAKSTVRYEHRDRHADALLRVADAIAWCWQHDGKWKDRVMRLITHSIDAAADSAKPGPPA